MKTKWVAATGLLRHRTLEALHRRGLGGRPAFVSEFPKSGGTWVKEMTVDLLRAMEPGAPAPSGGPPTSVLHQHWPYRPALRPAVYVLRDGRDVVVSLYYHMIRHLRTDTLFSRRARRYCRDVLGPSADPMDTRANLPAFIRSLSEHPFAIILRPGRDARFRTWPRHVADWMDRPGVLAVRYEDLLEDAPEQLTRIARHLGGSVDAASARAIADRHSFEARTGRKPGTEDPIAFRRKGVAGDWRNHFSPEATELFAAWAGSTLVELGYETDDAWVARA